MSDRAVPRRGFDTLTRWLLGAQWRSHRGRALVAMLTIALGVGLGYAVQLINGAAFNEFSAAARSLSGGEQQRLALARALARDPAILFLDEPTASLDPTATKAVEDIIRTVSERNIKVVMATHDLGEARRLAGDVVMLHRGRIVENGATASFFDRPQTAEARTFLAGELLV